jgi:prepilin-type processing-associated H-X9-DG protein
MMCYRLLAAVATVVMTGCHGRTPDARSERTSGPRATSAAAAALHRDGQQDNRDIDSGNLRKIAIALHNYHSGYRRLPPAAISDKQGRPLLSWRVAILPFLEENNLYRQFHLNESWDSGHNKTLLPLMPRVFRLPGAGPEGKTASHYRVFVGPDAVFDYRKSRNIPEITDGTSSTWMVVESAEAVPWTKPEELVCDSKKPLPQMGNFFSGGFNTAFADGSVRFFRKSPPEATMRALITAAGGEVVGLED